MVLRKFISIILFSWLVFFGGWFFVYITGINNLAIQSEDTIPAMFLPVTIIKEGTFYADSYFKEIISTYPHPDDKNYTKGLVPFYFSKVNSHYISAFPVMAGLLSIPVYLIPLVVGIEITWENLRILSHLASSLIVAISGGLFYLLLRKFIDERKAILLVLIYLFGTVNFAMVAQALWQHGAVQLFIILSLLFVFKERSEIRNIAISGMFLGLAILSRPTVAILLPYLIPLTIYLRNNISMNDGMTWRGVLAIKKTALIFITGLVPAVLFFTWYNSTYFLSLANQGYADQVGVNWLTPFPLGFLGLWLSPSKGILVYSSVFIFSLVGSYLALRKGGWRKNFPQLIFLSVVLTYTFILGAWKHWYGGYSFGYRMASDVIPFLLIMIIPYLKSDLFVRTKKIFYLTVVISLLFELMGLAFFDGIWHGTYDKGFWDQGWLWSIENSEIIFNIKRILLKLPL